MNPGTITEVVECQTCDPRGQRLDPTLSKTFDLDWSVLVQLWKVLLKNVDSKKKHKANKTI